MATSMEAYTKLGKVTDWIISHPSVSRTSHTDREVTVLMKNEEDRKHYQLADYSSVEELAAAIAIDLGFADAFGQPRGSKRGKYYFFNMANEWEDTIIGNLTNGGYKEVEDPEDAEKTTVNRAVDGISDWVEDCGREGLDAKAFVLEATKNGSASHTFSGEGGEYTLTLTVVNDPSEYEYFEDYDI